MYAIVDTPVTILKDTIIKAGSLEFQVIADTNIDTVNKELYVRAAETGTEYNIGEREINTIEGYTVNEIYNPYPFANGEDLESDSDFRYRLKNSKNSASTATYDAITTALLELDVVNDVVILDPKTTPSTANGTVEIIRYIFYRLFAIYQTKRIEIIDNPIDGSVKVIEPAVRRIILLGSKLIVLHLMRQPLSLVGT